jgi:hypothetical protein
MRQPLTLEQAKALVQAELGTSELVILDEATIERDFGWVFFYQNRSYLETRNILKILAGNAPYIVNRHTRELQVTGTGRPIEEYIARYERYGDTHV